MNVLWLFPESAIEGKHPNVSQYRFFKYGNDDSIIYPYLAAMGCTQLTAAGFRVKMLDCPTEHVSQNLHTYDNIDIVILECRTPILKHIYRIADSIRNLRVKVVMYGDHATAFPEEAKKHCDVVVLGGDFDSGVLSACRELRDHPQTEYCFTRVTEDNLDALPTCDRELVNWRKYYESWRHRQNFFWTMSARGCNYNCTFCAWCKVLWSNVVRARTPDNVADEFAMLHKTYGDCEILDDADIFKQDWGVVLARKLEERSLCNEEVIWAVQTHPNEIRSKDAWAWMQHAGLHTVKLGIESTNQETLNHTRKGTTVKQIEFAIKTLKDVKIMVHANMMVGFPWESKDDMLRTVKFIKKLDPNQAQFSLVIAYPWTDLYAEAQKKGWIFDDSVFDATQPMLRMQASTLANNPDAANWLKDTTLFANNKHNFNALYSMKPKEIAELYEQCWSDFYFAPTYVAKKVLKAIAHSIAERNLNDMRILWHGYRSVKNGHMKSMDDST
jgi:anaerobic magnesium-protoporphyrin IX monomethyl ester cyclase